MVLNIIKIRFNPMNKKQPMRTIFLWASLLSLMFGALVIATGGQIYAKSIWDDDDTMEGTCERY